MFLVNFLLRIIYSGLESLPNFDVTKGSAFAIVSALETLYDFLIGANYFLPLVVMGRCFFFLMLVENYQFFSRIFYRVVNFIRG